jgi:SAM-dependent methyltransferase
VSVHSSPANAAVRDYWNQHIHDLEITKHPVGSPGFFADLDQYHFEKLHHLPRLIRFDGYRGRAVLEVGCGAGTDLVRFARGGANVTGVDLSASAIALARENFAQQGLTADLREADGERLPFADATFDLVYAHGVVQYTSDPAALIRECHRVLKPGGEAVFQVYNRVSWLNALSKLMKVPLEHEDAPVLRKYSAGEFRSLLGEFREIRIVEERFPVKSRLHGGWKGLVFNTFFVGTFNALPRGLVRRFGWHLLAFCRKAPAASASGRMEARRSGAREHKE